MAGGSKGRRAEARTRLQARHGSNAMYLQRGEPDTDTETIPIITLLGQITATSGYLSESFKVGKETRGGLSGKS